MSDSLEFTGERFTPECEREIWYEHYHRYALAARWCANKRTLDAACGEGYGSSMLASTAASVEGVDISSQAIEHARQRYGQQQNINFQVSDCTALPFGDDEFDRVVSFETLEHLAEQEQLLAEFSRVLKADGCLILSSPDKATYSDAQASVNEYHVKELYRDELEALIGRHFDSYRLLGQKLMFHSAIWSMDGFDRVALDQVSGDERSSPGSISQPPMYFIALCAADSANLPDVDQSLWLFDDREESVYQHYHSEIKRHIAAGGIIARLEKELEALKSQAQPSASQASAGGVAYLVKPETEMSVATVIVNYNAGETLQQCVNALLKSVVHTRIILVDNASSDGSAEQLHDQYGDHEDIDFLFNTTNPGFAPAINAAVRQLDVDWVLILNPDCILEPEALGRLKQALEKDTEAALAGPAVRDDDGQLQRATVRRFPGPWRSLMTACGLWRLGKWFPVFHGIEVDIPETGTGTISCDAVSGACMFIRRSALEEVGLFDEGYYLHCEDLDLMYRFRERGWHCLFVPGASCVHEQGTSSKSRPNWVHFQKHRGMARFFRKFQARSTFLPVRMLVYAGIWTRFLISWPLVLIRR